MSQDTKRALDDIRRAVANGEQTIAPVTFSHFYGRAATAAAFRMARAAGLIEVAYQSAAGTPVYRAAGVGEAVVEAAGSIKH